ncbi:hypothetical protein [Trichlorobacter ammonificans]|uniref:Uncharacterized protein n=1 Tax=Trichlorobacter ammonificans TaxID=2916410 RepID=A0ABM9D733_9BACT|nr:hypothetical protein [Trichlorobacter ammonificans]CAH2030988.1 conserved exported protein of unknown function [Trichlorobacter ammonificans]
MKRLVIAVTLIWCSLGSMIAGATDPDPQKQQQLLKKIEELEQQISELRSLQLKKQTLPVKKEQCMKVVGVESYCTCVSEALPATVDYRQFVQILLTPAAEFGYDKLTVEQKKDVDQALVAWARCVDYKGPQGSGAMDRLMNRETLF